MNARIRQAAGDFIAGWAKWTWFVTLTFKKPVSETLAMKSVKAWLRWIARDNIALHFRVALAMERTEAHVLHFHLVLAIPNGPYGCDPFSDTPESRVANPFGPWPFDAVAADKQWKLTSRAAGMTQIEKFVSGGGAAHYVAKTEGWDAGVVCNRARSCCRQGGCTEGRAAWT